MLTGMGDDYERDYMDGDGAVYREKHVSKLFSALMLLPALGAAVGGIAAAVQGDFAAAGALAVGAVGAGTAGVFFSVMRTIVTPTELRVQYGTLGPTVELSSIRSVEVVRLNAMTRLAIGPKIWPEGWRYVFPGATHGVRIVFQDGKRTKTITIAADDPEALAAAIHQSSATVGMQVRVETSTEQEVEDVVESKREESETHP